jgi:hypothetical protein
VRLESRLQCDLNDGLVRPLQDARGALQTQTPHVLPQRLPDQPAKDAMKVKRRERRHPRDAFQLQFLVQMPLDVHERPYDPLAIVLLGCRPDHLRSV